MDILSFEMEKTGVEMFQGWKIKEKIIFREQRLLKNQSPETMWSQNNFDRQ